MSRVAPKETPRKITRTLPQWWPQVKEEVLALLNEAQASPRPVVGEGEYLVRLRPNVFLHESTAKPALRWKSNAWPQALMRLIAQRGGLRGAFRTEGRHWLVLKPDPKPVGKAR